MLNSGAECSDYPYSATERLSCNSLRRQSPPEFLSWCKPVTDEVASVRGVISDPEAVTEEVADRTDLGAIPFAPVLERES